jgi:predicted aminopeptidase
VLRMSRIKRLALGGMAFVLGGCSPGYVIQAAYNQSKILLGRRQIEKVISDPETDPTDRSKLKLVLEARAFAATIGLTPGGSFTAYTDIGKDTLAWVVVASRKDSFSLYTWWFPIVGTVPYKGFFSEADAIAQAKELEADGYESSVRGTEAFSTLGWFNDPVLSTTLKNPPVRIANTVLHESVHATVWIPGNVAFNESLANFVGGQATIEFYRAQQQECHRAHAECAAADTFVAAAERDLAFQLEFGDTVTRLVDALEGLYGSQSLSREQKLERRERVFQEAVAPFRKHYPATSVLKTVNNAEIIQYKLYLTKLRLFEKLFVQSHGSWSVFFEKIREVQRAIHDDGTRDPFVVLNDLVETTG